MSIVDIITLALTIIGAIITLFGIIVGIVQLAREAKKSKISYVKYDYVNLLNSKINDFSSLKIMYGNNVVNKNLIYIKGAIVNNGSQDAICLNPEESLELVLPEGCCWKEFKIISSSGGFKCDLSFKNNTANLKFNLLKSEEYILFDGLIESDNLISYFNIDENLEFKQRLIDVKKIEIIEKPRSISSIKSSRSTLFVMLIGWIIGLIFMIVYMYFKPRNEILAYQKKDGVSIEKYTVSINKDDDIILREIPQRKFGSFHNRTTIISRDEFRNLYEPILTYKSYLRQIDFGLSVCLILILILTLFMPIVYWVQIRRVRLINRILPDE